MVEILLFLLRTFEGLFLSESALLDSETSPVATETRCAQMLPSSFIFPAVSRFDFVISFLLSISHYSLQFQACSLLACEQAHIEAQAHAAKH